MQIAQATIPILENLEAKSGADGFGLITNLGEYVARIISAVLTVGGIATLIYMIMGGIQWIMSGNDKTKVEEARTRLTNAVIGLAIVAASWAVFLLADYFFGLGLTETT
ncbi:hypothetical protein A3B57_04200 [Microgenomates group bacterium RIFCSPLOWO2_01_FULL_47_10]|nr:MAG: hypothetical protein A3B57_04200 [Microgenomates group bacterium RIFCSPLOWO2_01_FULL_47_10]